MELIDFFIMTNINIALIVSANYVFPFNFLFARTLMSCALIIFNLMIYNICKFYLF